MPQNTSIIETNELEELLRKNTPTKKVLLIDGQMPATPKGKSYFYYSEDLKDFDAAPFGLARIAGYLDAHGIDNTIIRLRDYYSSPEKVEELKGILKNFKIIGISGLSNSAPQMYELCTYIKRNSPDATVVGGREHFGLDYEWVLKNKTKTGIDACCTSQGELVMMALALDIPVKKIGSLAYENENGEIIRNQYFPRLNEKESQEILHPKPAKELPIEWQANIFPEFQKQFSHCGDTSIGTGCPYSCTFCANHKFMESRKYVPSPTISEKEITAMKQRGMNFFFVRDLLLNASEENLNKFLAFMSEINSGDQKMKWAAFASVRKNPDLKNLFQKMEDSGCIEIMVGVEDIVGNRKELKKGEDNEAAAEFIDLAGEHMLVRAFLILGLPEHYKFTREEIKRSSLEFMKQHPQAIYRMGLWTPIVGTSDFEKYKFMLNNDIREDVHALEQFDTMHYVIDHQKVYEHLEIPVENQWIKNSSDWEFLRDEIIKEYYESEEHREYLHSLKDKDLLFEGATNFSELTLARLKKDEKATDKMLKMR